MSDATHLLLMLLSWIIISAGCHAYIKRYFVASFVAAVACVIVVQIASYNELGHLDPYWHISSITGFFMAGIVSLVVGLPFRITRTINQEDT